MPVSDEQMNLLMKNITDNIPTNCSAYEDIQRRSKNLTPILGRNAFNISDYQAYRNDIEFVNSFPEQVRIDEAQYFVNKYSQKVYDFLLRQRNAYIAQKRDDRVSLLCPKKEDGTDPSKCPPNTCNNPDHSKCTDTNTFLEYLKKQTQSNVTRPETTYKKIEYRNEAHELLDTMNYGMTLFYFGLLFFLLILLATTNRLFLRERVLLYLFLFLLPFLFPYLFDLLKNIYAYLFPDAPTRGPQNAFVESL